MDALGKGKKEGERLEEKKGEYPLQCLKCVDPNATRTILSTIIIIIVVIMV